MGKTNLASNLGENLIINPSMDLWQRGLTFSGLTSTQYFADRFKLNFGGAGYNIDAERSTDVPDWSYGQYSMELTNKAANSPGSSDFLTLGHLIEGLNFRKVANRNAYFVGSFKTTIAGIYTFGLVNNAGTRTFLQEMDLPANTWVEIKIPVAKIDTAIGVWELGTGLGLAVGVSLSLGSSLKTQSTFGNWINSNFTGSVDQANWAGTLNAEFYMTEWQFVEGTNPHPFREIARDFATEVELAQRYYEKSYNIDVAPGTPGASGQVWQQTNGNTYTYHAFKTRKRATGIGAVYSQNTGAIGKAQYSGGGDVNLGNGVGEGGMRTNLAIAAGNVIYYQWTIDAEI